jgi:hypothetical protein
VCVVSTAPLVFLAFICKVASAKLSALQGKSMVYKATALKVKEYIIIIVTRIRASI